MKDYGEEWLDTREGTFADDVPREADFKKAALILHKISDQFSTDNQSKVEGMSKKICFSYCFAAIT